MSTSVKDYVWTSCLSYSYEGQEEEVPIFLLLRRGRYCGSDPRVCPLEVGSVRTEVFWGVVKEESVLGLSSIVKTTRRGENGVVRVGFCKLEPRLNGCLVIYMSN